MSPGDKRATEKTMIISPDGILASKVSALSAPNSGIGRLGIAGAAIHADDTLVNARQLAPVRPRRAVVGLSRDERS
jgi:hypothetical protein